MQNATGNYASVNGLNLYYEIHGEGFPLVLLHGGGSTIYSTYGRILPDLAKKHMVIAVELQAHGHTPDIDRPLTFEQDADDVAELLNELRVVKADFMGFSNGGTTCIEIAIRHAERVNKLVLIAALVNRNGMPADFWEGMKKATIENMPEPLKQAYLEINPDPSGLMAMFNRDRDRMLEFRDIPPEKISGINRSSLVINGDRDVVTVQHALELSALLKGRLAIIPGAHGEYIGEICSGNKIDTIPILVNELIEEFLYAAN
ncbi:MAG TPA: alpha/beta hydrolase [Bacteroidales bacterium]|nr:alpha/beta hydrolase [Bacteroidales bacterium]